MFGFISRNILTGLITILPIVLTAYLLYWLANGAEDILGGWIKLLISKDLYWPGMGVLAGLIVLFLVGILMHAYLFRSLFSGIEKAILHLPFIKPIYKLIRDFFDYFKPKQDEGFEQVVALTLPENGLKVIGFVTEPLSSELPDGFNDDEHLLVYLPLSYMIGGYTVLVPREQVTPVDLTMDEAMRFTLTAGVSTKIKTNK